MEHLEDGGEHLEGGGDPVEGGGELPWQGGGGGGGCGGGGGGGGERHDGLTAHIQLLQKIKIVQKWRICIDVLMMMMRFYLKQNSPITPRWKRVEF